MKKNEADHMIMLGAFSKNTPQYADKRKKEAEAIIDKVAVVEKNYLIVMAGPFDKKTAEENLDKLTAGGMNGYIFATTEEESEADSEENAKG